MYIPTPAPAPAPALAPAPAPAPAPAHTHPHTHTHTAQAQDLEPSFKACPTRSTPSPRRRRAVCRQGLFLMCSLVTFSLTHFLKSQCPIVLIM